MAFVKVGDGNVVDVDVVNVDDDIVVNEGDVGVGVDSKVEDDDVDIVVHVERNVVNVDDVEERHVDDVERC